MLVPFPFVTRSLFHGASPHFPVLVDAFGLPPSDVSCVLSQLVGELLPHAFSVLFSFSPASSFGLCELSFHASAVAGASYSWEGEKERGGVPGGMQGGGGRPGEMEGGKERRKGREEWKEEGVREREMEGEEEETIEERKGARTRLQENSCHFY